MKNNQNGLASSSTGLTITNQLLPKTPIKGLANNSNIIELLTKSQNNLKDEAKELTILKKIFYYYSLNERNITYHQYVKLLHDSKISTNENDEHLFSIIFNASNKILSNIPFALFCEIIVQIAEMKYYSTFITDQSIALNNLFSDHLIPLIHDLQKKNKILSSNWKFYLMKLSLKDTINTAMENTFQLKQIYNDYFIDNYNIITDNNLLTTKAEKGLIQFCKDFDIFPKYSTLSKVKEIFYTITSIYSNSLMTTMNQYPENNEGRIFTFYHFIACLFFLSLKNNYTYSNNQINNKIWTHLALKELINNIITKTKYDQISLLKKINSNEQFQLSNSKQSTCFHSRKFSIEINNENNQFLYKSKQSKKMLNKANEIIMKTVDEFVNGILSSYSNILLIVYKYYSELYHDGIYSVLMSKKGIMHCLRDLQLDKACIESNENIKRTNQSIPTQHHYNENKKNSFEDKDKFLILHSLVEYIFKKYSCDTSYKNHINFNLFLRITLIIASKINNNSIAKRINLKKEKLLLETFLSRSTINYIDNNYSLKIYQSFLLYYVNPLHEKIKKSFTHDEMNFQNIQLVYNKRVFQLFFDEIKALFLPIIPFYSKEYNIKLHTTMNNLSFDEFLLFLTHYDLFPALICKNNLMRLITFFVPDFSQIILNGSTLPKISSVNCLMIVIFICIGTKSVEYSTENYLKISVLLQKIIKSKGLNIYISNTINSKIMNDLMQLFQKYEEYSKDKNDLRQSFFNLISK